MTLAPGHMFAHDNHVHHVEAVDVSAGAVLGGRQQFLCQECAGARPCDVHLGWGQCCRRG